jgi:hypothetical protein
VLGALPLTVSSCGGNKGVAQASPSLAAVPMLLDIGDFSLLRGRPAHTLFHATKAHPLRIYIIANRPLDSVKLRRMANDDGSLATAKAIPLQGSPHDVDGQTLYALITPQVEPGYFRLDLLGRGRVQSLAVRDW